MLDNPSVTRQVLYASLAQYIELRNSLVWLDITTEVNAWLEDIRNQLESVSNIEELRRFQGIAEACRHFLQLPEQIINSLEVRGETDGGRD